MIFAAAIRAKKCLQQSGRKSDEGQAQEEAPGS
jgi:hypothetical protein